MTTHQTSDIGQRLADAEAELTEAQRDIGAVVLDGGDERAASERVATARAEVERLTAAAAEQQVRSEAAKSAARARASELRRWRELCWYAEYLERLKPVLKLRAELDDAEQQMMALGHVAAVVRCGVGDYQGPRGIGLPYSAVIAGSEDRFQRDVRANDALLTVEDCEAKAAELAVLIERAAVPLGSDGQLESLPWGVS